jgi:hypothetical protein
VVDLRPGKAGGALIPPRRVRRRLLLTSLLGAGACATGTGSLSDLPVSELRGHATVRETDRTWFVACGAGAADSVWVTFTERSVDQREEARLAGLLAPGSRSFVRWRAAEGDARHGVRVGPGDRYVLVREILEVRPVAPGDCVDLDT